MKTNIEAVHEIARQLRLRNIGGMVIVDFIDMTSRADKLAMLEELEIALEADKAKPQVGQLSDLGLVELTRHRQGQSLAEIFTKKCPHCQGSGCSVIDFNFATPVAEGEYRAKAAKVKLPSGAFKKNNKFNKNNNKPQNEEIAEIQTEEAVEKPAIETEPAVAAAEETIKKENNRRNRKNRFNKNKKDAQTSEPKSEEIAVPVEEIPSEPEAEPKKQTKRRSTRKTKVAEMAAEVPSEKPAEEIKEEKPKKRPNRGASKKTKTVKKKVENEE